MTWETFRNINGLLCIVGLGGAVMALVYTWQSDFEMPKIINSLFHVSVFVCLIGWFMFALSLPLEALLK